MEKNTFQVPKSVNVQNKVEISVDDVIPKGEGLFGIISNEVNNKKTTSTNDNQKSSSILINNIEYSNVNQVNKNNVIMSNNQVYAKKSDIEYGKKSHMEFIKIQSQNKYPIGNPLDKEGKYRLISMKEIEEHNSKGSLWTVINRAVYDLTTYLDYHPGGEKKLLMGAGTDCTFLFSICY
jgi:cytochrome b involved in lipid metabolism